MCICVYAPSARSVFELWKASGVAAFPILATSIAIMATTITRIQQGVDGITEEDVMILSHHPMGHHAYIENLQSSPHIDPVPFPIDA